MKKLIFANGVLALALIFSFCSKPSLNQELSAVNPDTAASDREKCCLQFVVTTTTFQSAEICGVYTSGSSCTPFTSGCGTSSGFSQTIQKNGMFCVSSWQPFRVTNTSATVPFDFHLTGPGGNSATFTLLPLAAVTLVYDCTHPATVCD
ncbi:MAG: hypothetical protein H7246_16160 [Phycisphaerae bacterium]|nr:hypothetical protein [Saprospiraceae bacterium]